MTQQEKDEFNKRHFDRIANEKKSKTIWAIVIPVIGIIITVLIGFAEKSKQGDIASATVLDSQSVGDFLGENQNGGAIYTGTISAVDSASIRGEDGDYIYIHRKVENEREIYNEETEKYERETTTYSDDSDHCDEIMIDDVVAKYSVFHSLPQYSENHSDGAKSNKMITTYTYTPSSVEGTFFIKCKDGEISSAEYYKSADVAGESQKGFGVAKVLIWLAIIAIEIYLIVKIISAAKILKGNNK